MSMEPDPGREQPSYVIATEHQTPPPTSPPGPVAGQTNGLAIASLVLGILGLVWFPPVIPSILALIFGYKAKGQIDRSDGREQGRGLAIAGIVLGWVAVVLLLLGVLLLFAAFSFSVGGSQGSWQIERMLP